MYESMEAVADRPVVQDYLIGRDVGVAMVMDAQSRPVDFFCYESLQEYPLAGGPTCLCQTMFDRQLVEYAAVSYTHLGVCPPAGGGPEAQRLVPGTLR